MTSTDNIPYPILLFSNELCFFDFKSSPQQLIERKDSLRRLGGLKGVLVIDNNLQEYQIAGTHAVRGHGFLSGYFIEGPFLRRKVVFRADLRLVRQLNLRSGAEMIATFMRGAQSVRPNDVSRFWQGFETFLPNAKPTLESLWTFYSSFRWGDDLVSNDKA